MNFNDYNNQYQPSNSPHDYARQYAANKAREFEEVKTYQIDLKRSFLFSFLFYIAMFYVGVYFFQYILMFVYSDVLKRELYVPSIPEIKEITDSAYAFLSAWLQICIYVPTTIVVIILLRKALSEDLKHFKKTALKSLGMVVIGIIAIYGCNIVCNVIIMSLGIDGVSDNQDSINQLVMSDYMIFIAIVTVVCAPILEELVYRKSLFALLQPRFKTVEPVIFITGTIFGLIHVISSILTSLTVGAGSWEIISELVMGIPYVTMGICFGYVYQYSKRRIVPVILLHSLNNAIALLFTIFLSDSITNNLTSLLINFFK